MIVSESSGGTPCFSSTNLFRLTYARSQLCRLEKNVETKNKRETLKNLTLSNFLAGVSGK